MLVSSIILLLLRHNNTGHCCYMSAIELATADTLEQSCANFEILCKIVHYVNDNNNDDEEDNSDNNDDDDDDDDDGDSEHVL